MATVTIGHSKTYDWSKGALVNLQHTNITTNSGADGWMVLAFEASTTEKAWSNLTDWTVSANGTATATSDGTELTLTNPTGVVNISKTSFLDADVTHTVLNLIKFDSYGTTAAQWNGFTLYGGDGTRRRAYNWHSDGTYEDLYNYSPPVGDAVKYDTTYPIDTSRYHIRGYYNADGADADVMVIDGEEILTGIDTYTSSSDSRKLMLENGGNPVTVKVLWTKHWNTPTPWETTDATWTSTYDDAIFDAGSGNQWKKLDWTAVTANSTGLVMKVRCAATSGGLSSATYETVTSGTDFTTKDRYIQIECTMSDASSGRFTPVLKDLTMTDEEGSGPVTPTVNKSGNILRKFIRMCRATL